MKRLNFTQKKDALNNALRSFGFNERYFIYPADARLGQLFGIAQNTKSGGISLLTRVMSYDEMNAYLQGYNHCKQNKFKP